VVDTLKAGAILASLGIVTGIRFAQSNFNILGLRGVCRQKLEQPCPCRPGRWKKSRPKDHQGCVREVVRSSLSSSSGRQNKGVGIWLWDRCSHSSRPIIPPQGVVPARWVWSGVHYSKPEIHTTLKGHRGATKRTKGLRFSFSWIHSATLSQLCRKPLLVHGVYVSQRQFRLTVADLLPPLETRYIQ
jgi:hypothetical protein